MKFFFIFALALSLATLAHAGSQPDGGFDKNKLLKVEFGKKLCGAIQGTSLKRWVGKGGGTQCDNYVLQNFPTDRTSLAVAICKSPDLEGQVRDPNDVASCFETAAKEIGKDTDELLFPKPVIKLNTKLLADSNKCKSRLVCLQDVFDKAIPEFRKEFGMTAANPNQAAQKVAQPAKINATVPALNSRASVAPPGNKSAPSMPAKDMAEARKRGDIRRGKIPNQ
jgi:hypothetical protein